MGHYPDPAAAERRDIEAVPARRLGRAEEAHISGVVLPVDGGFLRGVW